MWVININSPWGINGGNMGTYVEANNGLRHSLSNIPLVYSTSTRNHQQSRGGQPSALHVRRVRESAHTEREAAQQIPHCQFCTCSLSYISADHCGLSTLGVGPTLYCGCTVSISVSISFSHIC